MLLTQAAFATSAFPPLALGFFGLGTGYLIVGPQELVGRPRRDAALDRADGAWGFWMPGFCQFVTGVILFIGLTWFSVFREPPLYMAALAFSAFGIHWFALGLIRYTRADVRANGFMCVPFMVLSALGAFVFFVSGTWAVGVLFIGLFLVYFTEFFASFSIGARATPEGVVASNPGERALGVAHTVTGLWLMYLTVATTLDLVLGYALPAG